MYLLPLPDRTRTAVAAMTERRDLYLDALEQLNAMRDRAFKAEAAVRRVQELHYAYDAMDLLRRCGCCGHPWPCLTARALGGDA